ncbi:MAG: hypothetical protein JO316_10230 [Abitibacteriaceae bacterium]|nr:hypothetical protein [Abditibacteriaceae bacterium]
MDESAADDHFADDEDDPRISRPPSLADVIPPVRWPLALLAGVFCAVAASWQWVSVGPSRLVVIAAVVLLVWLAFASRGSCGAGATIPNQTLDPAPALTSPPNRAVEMCCSPLRPRR